MRRAIRCTSRAARHSYRSDDRCFRATRAPHANLARRSMQYARIQTPVVGFVTSVGEVTNSNEGRPLHRQAFNASPVLLRCLVVREPCRCDVEVLDGEVLRKTRNARTTSREGRGEEQRVNRGSRQRAEGRVIPDDRVNVVVPFVEDESEQGTFSALVLASYQRKEVTFCRRRRLLQQLHHAFVGGGRRWKRQRWHRAELAQKRGQPRERTFVAIEPRERQMVLASESEALAHALREPHRLPEKCARIVEVANVRLHSLNVHAKSVERRRTGEVDVEAQRGCTPFHENSAESTAAHLRKNGMVSRKHQPAQPPSGTCADGHGERATELRVPSVGHEAQSASIDIGCSAPLKKRTGSASAIATPSR